MLLGYLPVIRQQIIMPCTTVCVCVCVCVCIRQRHHSYVHERETHTVTDSDREGDTFTHIHTFFHSLSLSDHCDVITPPIDILQERETHRIFQKRHTHPWFWMVVCRSPAI
jgi:hypothetical protein